jgi:hypothetical protein
MRSKSVSVSGASFQLVCVGDTSTDPASGLCKELEPDLSNSHYPFTFLASAVAGLCSKIHVTLNSFVSSVTM